ncbi:hypothetical protein BB561_000151 [Smittium simulii]|uniref:Uncharacterized protein n=1 Tax=Smittium simulii TaxID=133385 RepID=A0A2T9Z0B9_9FUNG|nr:hypothetical protein BB561_000151 [Smittium simulii]
MPRVPGVIPSAAARVSLTPAKRTRLEYSTVANTGLIDPATKNDYNFNFPSKNSQKKSKKSKKYKKMPNCRFSLNKIDVLSECDIAPTWSDITTALKTTPSNKSAGIDTIPSELWKLIQDEIQPTSYLAKKINKTINKAWDNCNLIGTTNTSVVLIAKIVANKQNALDTKYNILCKEQAGFRTKEECFIDFEKAYDRVPHNQLFHKLEYSGIADTEAGTSCNWTGLELVYPELKTHINYVFKIRNGTYWTARRYAKSGFIEKRFIEECPFCRNIAPETIEHMLLECNRWQALRADILAQYINIYRAQVATKPPLLPASISMRLVGKLLGEELKLSSTRIRKDPTVLCVKTTLATFRSLNVIALSRYLIPSQYPPGTGFPMG